MAVTGDEMRGHNDVTRIILPLFCSASPRMAAAQPSAVDFACWHGNPASRGFPSHDRVSASARQSGRRTSLDAHHRTPDRRTAGHRPGASDATIQGADKRGVTIWVETDGTVLWSTAETAIPRTATAPTAMTNKYIDNSKTITCGEDELARVEFGGNFPT